MLQSENYIAIPPGATIKEQLDNRGMTQKEFAERMGLSVKHISRLINGEVQLTHEVALKLSSDLGLPTSFWNNLESIYREQLTLVKDENKMEEEKSIAKELPYADCANLGWFPKTRDSTEKVRNLRSFFGVSDLTIPFYSNTLNIAFRRLSDKDTAQVATNMWIQKAKNVADTIHSDKININGLTDNLNRIREMTVKNPVEFYPELEGILSSHGVKLILLPTLKNSYLHGASFQYRDSIVLGITVRGRDADKFWFSLFHEIGHIIQGHVFEEEITEQMEDDADRFSQMLLIPENDYSVFSEKGEFNRTTITSFADEIQIDKGIVIGRVQKDGFLKFNQFTDMKMKYDLNTSE